MAATECETPLDCARHSVVSLLPSWPAGFTRNEEPEGSGIALGEGDLIATADHVLGPAKTARIRTLSGMVMEAEIVLRDPLTDIAILKVSEKIKPLALGMAPVVGEEACAIGNSFGLDISLTCGVVSAKNVSGTGFNRVEDFVQTDAAVNPGMSGGALVNAEGELLGMLSAIFTRQSDANIGVNFAVSTQLLLRVLEDFEQDGLLSHTMSGLLLRPADTSKSGGRTGLTVMRVKTDSPEDKAGIKKGDILLEAGGRRLGKPGAYQSAISLLKKGNSLGLQLLRSGQTMVVNINF